MVKIDVDSEVFGFLQEHARPFMDTPNDVLRRLLLARESKFKRRFASAYNPEQPLTLGSSSAEAYVRAFLTSHFGSGFERRSPYRMMFESQDSLVYFQNFNKESDHLWYRVNEKPWKELRASRKEAWIVLTNPAGRFGFALPVADLKDRIQRANWSRNYLEINIDPSTSRWSELDWNLTKYRKTS